MHRPADSMSEALQNLAIDLPRLRGRDAGAMIARLRALAMVEGRTPVAEIADGLAAALLRDRDGTPIGPWIEALRAAATMTPADRGVGPLLLATIGVRLAH